MLRLARTCSEAGFEVICIADSDPRAIVVSAIQECVDHIGITTLPGASVEDFCRLFDLLRQEGLQDIRITAGGIFPQKDIPAILEMGISQFFPGSSIYGKIEAWKALKGERLSPTP